MTRKDYEAIALILRSAREVVEERSGRERLLGIAPIEYIEEDLIRLFESDNPRFNRSRFRTASRSTRRHREAITAQLA